MSDIKDYGEDIQELFLRFLVTDPDVFVRVNNIVESTCPIENTEKQ